MTTLFIIAGILGTIYLTFEEPLKFMAYFTALFVMTGVVLYICGS